MRIHRLSRLAAVLVLDLATVLAAGQQTGIAHPHMRGMTWMHGGQARAKLNAPGSPKLGTPSFQFVSIDVPNAVDTLTTGINPQGDIVGTYYDADFNQHGFLLKNGQFFTVDVPGSLIGVSGTLQTQANGINAAGDIVGDYFAPPGAPGAPACTAWTNGSPNPECVRGFLYRDGQFFSVLFPGHPGSIPNSITPGGDIYGCLHDLDFGTSMFGFSRRQTGGQFQYISLTAGGGELTDSAAAVPVSMNNGATPGGNIIVGLYFDLAIGKGRGYVVQKGTFTPYDVPGSVLTQAWGINPAADFVGLYDDASGNEHGFLQRWGAATPITIDVPSAPPFNAVLTDSFAINPAGAMVGLYIDNSGNLHGYLAIPGK